MSTIKQPTVGAAVNNTAPTAKNTSFSINEDTKKVFLLSDFGFSDVDTGDTLQSVQITSLPLAGKLLLDNVVVTLNQIINAADIAAGRLVFAPAENAFGASYGKFSFKVSDGVASSSNYVATINVTPVNDAPTARSTSVTINEDTVKIFAIPDFGFTDADVGDVLKSVQISALPTAGKLLLNGIAVTLNQIITAADIMAGKLAFVPASNAFGTNYANFNFKVSDGVASSGDYAYSINITPVNDAPTGKSAVVTITEDNSKVFALADFGFADADVGDVLKSVQISILPAAGKLTLNGIVITLNQVISAADIANGKLVFTPSANAFGPSYAKFGFKLSDGTASSNDYAMTINVTPVNDVPTGQSTSFTINKDTAKIFGIPDFGFADADIGDVLKSVQITALPLAGKLLLNGTAVTANQVINATDIIAGKLVFIPAPNATGTNYAAFGFKVSDGLAASSATYTATINVAAINTAPTGKEANFVINEDTPKVFALADFGFADINPNDTLKSVQIIGLPIAGKLLLNNVAVTTDQVITAADIAAGKLAFVPAENAFGKDYAKFGFKVSDGTASSPAYTATISVTPVNDAPTARNNAITMSEDTAKVLGIPEFGFADVDVGDVLKSVQISTLPAAGKLLLNGVAVTLNQVINAADIIAGKLVFIPADNAFGAAYAKVGFKVSDGLAYSPDYALTINVTPVNDAPTAKSAVVIIEEDNSKVFALADFGFADVDVGDVLKSVQISALPNAGKLLLNGVAVLPNQVIAAVDIAAGKLVFTPAPNAFGKDYAKFGFKVSDGTAMSVDCSMTINVTPVNDAPTGKEGSFTISKDGSKVFAIPDFGFADIDVGDVLKAVQITALPVAGKLLLNGVAVTLNQVINAADIIAGKLVFTPAPGAIGNNYANFGFKVSDGLASSAASYNYSINVVNTAPTGKEANFVISEDTPKVFALADFGFVDANASDSLKSVQIVGLPIAGKLLLNNVAVTMDQIITAADIATGKLVFTPAPNAFGKDYAKFGFKVSDGTASSPAYTATISVTPVNDAPTGQNASFTVNRDTGKVFAIPDFGFADIDVGDVLKAVQITTLPLAGKLLLNGVGVTVNQVITAGDIAAGRLTFAPAVDASGNNYATFGFKVSDGIAASSAAYTATINIAVLGTSYAFNLGDSNTLTTISGTAASDSLKLSDTKNLFQGWDVYRSGPDLVLDFFGTNGDIKLSNQYAAPAPNRIETLVLEGKRSFSISPDLSGTVGNDLIVGASGADVIQGGLGDDLIFGGAGNDTLDGGAGNDSLSGGLGNDHYRFQRGGGSDVITDMDTTAGNQDHLDFALGIDASQLWFRHVGNDLEVQVIGTPDTLRITNWYGGNANNQIEQFHSGDGKTLLNSQVENLVAAMATLQPPAAGQTTLPSNYSTSLNPILAANWK